MSSFDKTPRAADVAPPSRAFVRTSAIPIVVQHILAMARAVLS
jgi:hypothetical protein